MTGDKDYDFPSWVSGPLERALVLAQEASANAWILTDNGEQLVECLQVAQKCLADADYHLHRPLSRDELHNLASDLREALAGLCDAVPEIEELEKWGRVSERSNATLKALLVERQRFKLKLTPPNAGRE